MLIVVSASKVKPERRAEFLEMAEQLIAATRKEPGCISYELLCDPYDENSVTFLERWQDKQALELHLATPHIAAWRSQAAELRSSKAMLKLYSCEEVAL